MRAQRNIDDCDAARQAAESGIWFAREWIAKTPAWRTGPTVSFTNVVLGKATFDVLITDPTDNDVSDRPYDPVDITCTDRVGRAEQIMTAHLTASPQGYDSFSYAAASAGQIVNKVQLIVGSGTVSTNYQLDNNGGTIEGNVQAVSVKKAGTVTGTTTVGSSTRTIPSGASIAEWYASIGTQLSGVTSINKALLSPNANPSARPIAMAFISCAPRTT